MALTVGELGPRAHDVDQEALDAVGRGAPLREHQMRRPANIESAAGYAVHQKGDAAIEILERQEDTLDMGSVLCDRDRAGETRRQRCGPALTICLCANVVVVDAFRTIGRIRSGTSRSQHAMLVTSPNDLAVAYHREWVTGSATSDPSTDELASFLSMLRAGNDADHLKSPSLTPDLWAGVSWKGAMMSDHCAMRPSRPDGPLWRGEPGKALAVVAIGVHALPRPSTGPRR
jgi:hypothetical protein